jgi:Fe2+ transport system protein FeoA
MNKETHDALCALKYHARPEQTQAIQTIQKALDEKSQMVNVTTKTYEDRIVQTIDICGEVSYRIARISAKQMDESMRARLLELGWLPPEEVEKLRNLPWRQVGEDDGVK